MLSNSIDRKRPRNNASGEDWREGPSFLDATSSVAVSTFGARRLPELKNLYCSSRSGSDSKTLVIHEQPSLLSGGGKTSSRHLRRRTTAVDGKRHRHRYPCAKASNETGNNNGLPPKFVGGSRKSRRKKRRLIANERQKWLQSETNDNNNSTKPPLKWLVTHFWHAKRFHTMSMNTDDKKDDKEAIMGSWTGIPIVHTNRGPRAALRLSQDEIGGESTTVLIRDISWEGEPLLLCIEARTDKSVLLQLLGKICPEFLSVQLHTPERMESFFSGILSVEGTLHELDAFPSKAIGPTSWRMLPEIVAPKAAIEIRCHPSIRFSAEKILEEWITLAATPANIQITRSRKIEHSPKICFRLYGRQSMKVLNQVLKVTQKEKSTPLPVDLINLLPTEDLQRGHVFCVKHAEIIGAISDEGASNRSDLTMIYREPRPLDCPPNRALSGWEIYCNDATFANKLWLTLVTFDGKPRIESKQNESCKKILRGCCAIGLVEESHMRLECEPPVPVFPRDYIDTRESRKYWTASSSGWNCIRTLYEGGKARLPINRRSLFDKLSVVDFGELLADQRSEVPPSDIVAVRGAFGQPFLDVVRGCSGQYARNGTGVNVKKGHRRNRRPSRPKNDVLIPSPLSQEYRVSFGKMCNGLSSSLSLPAVLLVHVRAIDKGTIHAGMQILSANHSDEDGNILLGTITTGSFSTSRGVYHGIGAVGAVRLLDYVTRFTGIGVGGDEETSTPNSNGSDEIHYGRIVRLANGSQAHQLLVRIENDLNRHGRKNVGCLACLSIIT